MPPLPAHNRKSISQAGAKGNVFFAHGLKIRSFQGVPESCRCQSCRGIPACMRRIGHRIAAPWVKNRAAPLQERQLSPVRHAPHAAAPPDFPAWRSGRRAGADSPSAPGKQAKSAKGGRPHPGKGCVTSPNGRERQENTGAGYRQRAFLPGSAGCRGAGNHSPLPVSRNGKRDPFRSPSIFQISPGCGLPAGFTHTGQFAAQGHVAEAETADAELANEGPGTPADGSTIVGAGAELGLTGSLHFKSGTGHSSTPTCGTACPAGPEGTCLPCPWSPR